jgi:hypothetical protein
MSLPIIQLNLRTEKLLLSKLHIHFVRKKVEQICQDSPRRIDLALLIVPLCV